MGTRGAYVLVALLGLASPTRAQRADPCAAPAGETARRCAQATHAMAEGVKALRAGDAETAVYQFQRALDLVPEAWVPFRYLGEAYERLSRWENAIDSYEAYLELNPASTLAEKLRGRIAAIRDEHLEGRLAVHCRPAGARVFVDGAAEAVGVTPLDELRLAAGKHALRIVAEGFQERRFAQTVEAGTTTVLDCELPPVVVAQPLRLPDLSGTAATPGRRRWYRNGWIWAGAGTLVAVAVGAVFVLQSDLPDSQGGTHEFP